MSVFESVSPLAFEPMRHPTSHSLESIHKPQIHEPTEYTHHYQYGMREHIKYDEEYVHSEISGSIQGDPLSKPLPECESLRHRLPLLVHNALERR